MAKLSLVFGGIHVKPKPTRPGDPVGPGEPSGSTKVSVINSSY